VSGRYTLLEIKTRPAGARLPTVHLIDMRRERIAGDLPFVSLPLKTEVAAQLAEGRQVILFLNRRGYAPYLKCRECGHIPLCPNCQVRMTYHKVGDHLACHYCGTVRTDYTACEKCSRHEFLFFGAGTQKVEETVGRLWKDARPVRMDSDTATGRASSHALLSDFAAHKHNLLLGTQMVTKGLDLSDVSLVGVLAADQGMGLPDFRASERTFSRLLQVAGRSGRSEYPGKVFIQTWDPDQDMIADAARQDYRSFFDREIGLRREGYYPPFCRLVNVILSGEEDPAVEREAHQFRDQLVKLAAHRKLEVQVLGPSPCAFHRLRGKYRRHLFAKIRPDHASRFVRLLTDWEQNDSRFRLPAAVQVIIDVDPADML
jgi:primosomal protein N' (replication factor Y)